MLGREGEGETRERERVGGKEERERKSGRSGGGQFLPRLELLLTNLMEHSPSFDQGGCSYCATTVRW